MKNLIIGILIGVIGILSINAITPSLFTVKPAQPKSWVVISTNSHTVVSTIMKYSKEGYIVHYITPPGYSAHDEAMLVMYKYY